MNLKLLVDRRLKIPQVGPHFKRYLLDLEIFAWSAIAYALEVELAC
jgi:hypothetical protein